MNPADLLGKTFACACGKTHAILTEELVYAEDAARRLPDLLARVSPGRRVILLADTRTHLAAGQACAVALAEHGDWSVQTLIIPDNDHDDPVCDDLTRDALLKQWPVGDIILAAGSGVINDLAKWIACAKDLPYVVMATAASMNGYTSNNIAPAIRGIKRVIQGTVPRAVLAVPTVIEQAPYPLTAAGLGDVLAKPVSITDWKLNQLLFDEYYCPLCADMIRDLEPGYLDQPETILARRPEAIRSLFFTLIYSGIAMTMAGTSAPASGGEHMISHVLDMTSAIHSAPHDYHGRQVGLGTIFACALYERVLALEKPSFQSCAQATDEAYWQSLTTAVAEEHALKRRKAERAVRRLQQESALWEKLRATLKPMTKPAAVIKQYLAAAGAAHRMEDIGCRRERFLAAALHAHQMRERYTILDLAWAAGVLPQAAEEIVEEYLV